MGEDWKSKLLAMKPNLPKGEVKPVEVVSTRVTEPESERPRDPQQVEQERLSADYQDQLAKEKAEREAIQSEPDFLELIRILKLSNKDDRNYRILHVFFDVRRGDDSYNMNRFLNPDHLLLARNDIAIEDKNKLLEIIERLKNQGYCSAAFRWWKSAEPDGMRYGTASKDSRLKKAHEYANLAGTTIHKILEDRK
jgi:hypothetical protein